ncbi:hypothetical protein D3C87_1929820 [compost metagenome]
MHEHFPRRLVAGVFVLQRTEQAVQVLGVSAGRIAFRLGQRIHRMPELRLKMGDQRRGQGDHESFDILGKTETVH